MSEPIRFSEDVKQVSELKTRSAEIIGQVKRTRRPVLLTRRGRGVAVLLDVDEYERLVERQSFVEAVEVGAKAAVDGDLHPHEEALAILETFGEAMPELRPVLWTGPALADLLEIREWVERDSPEAARRLAAKIRDRVDDLAAFPASGRVVPEIGIERYREVIVPPFRVIYEIRENDLVILRVRHSRRDLPG